MSTSQESKERHESLMIRLMSHLRTELPHGCHAVLIVTDHMKEDGSIPIGVETTLPTRDGLMIVLDEVKDMYDELTIHYPGDPNAG